MFVTCIERLSCNRHWTNKPAFAHEYCWSTLHVAATTNENIHTETYQFNDNVYSSQGQQTCTHNSVHISTVLNSIDTKGYPATIAARAVIFFQNLK